MSLEAAILGFLHERPRSGYDLKTRCFDDASRAFWTADQAQIYRTLERLQAAGLVSSSRKRQVGKPDRRVYQITPAGRESLMLWLTTEQPLPPPREPFLLRLFFGSELDEARILTALSARRNAHQVRLDELRAGAVSSARNADSSLRQAALRDAAFDGAIALERAAIDWLDDVADGVRAGRLPSPDEADERSPHLFGSAPA
jgi:DNA-binding PadR family transcriptional regulator